MSKTHLNITIDTEILLYYRMKKINLSSKVNSYLKLEMDLQTNSKEEQELHFELEKLKQDEKEISNKKQELIVQIEFARSKKEKENISEMERIDRESAFFRQHNPARDF